MRRWTLERPRGTRCEPDVVVVSRPISAAALNNCAELNVASKNSLPRSASYSHRTVIVDLSNTVWYSVRGSLDPPTSQTPDTSTSTRPTELSSLGLREVLNFPLGMYSGLLCPYLLSPASMFMH